MVLTSHRTFDFIAQGCVKVLLCVAGLYNERKQQEKLRVPE
jgi:hypothetical protein